VLNESAHRRESAIARAGRVLADGFEVVEKRQNCLDVDVIEVKIGDRAADPIGDEQEEEAERMAVCADGVRARDSTR